MARILVDTNIYLEFFKTSNPALRKHAHALANEFKDEVFIPAQIVDEVDRNKVLISDRFINDQLAKISLPKISLPVFSEDTNSSLQEMTTKTSKLIDHGHDEARAHLERVSTGTDETSLVLRPLFAEAKQPSADQLSRARERRERGNPPGKSDDPLGDQIIWEQFLDQIKDSPVWIITKDSDYSIKSNGKQIPNALLVRNLQSKISNIEIRLFDSLAAGLKDFQEWSAVNTAKPALPISSTESVEAARVEQILTTDDDIFGNSTFCMICEPGIPLGFPTVSMEAKSQPPTMDNLDSFINAGRCTACGHITIQCRACWAFTPIDRLTGVVECAGQCGLEVQVTNENNGAGESWTAVTTISAPNFPVTPVMSIMHSR